MKQRLSTSLKRSVTLLAFVSALSTMAGCIVVVGGSSRGASSAEYAVIASPHRRIGIQMAEVSPALASQLGVEACRATVVARVLSGSPAERAGLRQFDVITGIDGQANASMGALQIAVGARKPGETVALKIARGGQAMDVAVEVEERAAWND